MTQSSTRHHSGLFVKLFGRHAHVDDLWEKADAIHDEITTWQARTATPKKGNRRPNGRNTRGGIVIPPNTGSGTLDSKSVAGHRPGRDSMSIVILIGGNLLCGSSAVEAAQQGATIQPGGDFTIEDEAEVWLYNPSTTTPVTVDIIESYWDLLEIDVPHPTHEKREITQGTQVDYGQVGMVPASPGGIPATVGGKG